MKKKAIIIGSGIAGIASSIRLAAKGYHVTVIEKNNYPGGKLTVIKQDGYRFDAGPSLFTLPNLVDELFQLANKDPRDYYTYCKLDTACHYFFDDGQFLKFYSDQQQLCAEIEDKLQIDPTPFKNHLKKSEHIYNTTRATFLEQSLHKLRNYWSLDILKCIVQIPSLNLFKTLHAANLKGLNHPKLVQIFDRYATYNGSNPYQAPGILQIIPHLEFGYGTYFPHQGMHTITQSLVKLATELGVVFQYNESVKHIDQNRKKIIGVTTDKKSYHADIVVCNSDIKPAYSHLMKEVPAPKKVMQQEPSSSAMIFYWGIKQSFPQMDVHNIFFSSDYEREFNTLFNELSVDSDPTVYVHISSKVVKEDAPSGCENWFVMVNVPSNQGQDWEQLRLQIRQAIIQKLNRILQIDLELLIATEDYLDPIRIESRTSSFGGALYGASSNDRMAAFFRHANFSKTKGLYFVGGSVHPGGGIPLCLLSAKIASELVPTPIK